MATTIPFGSGSSAQAPQTIPFGNSAVASAPAATANPNGIPGSYIPGSTPTSLWDLLASYGNSVKSAFQGGQQQVQTGANEVANPTASTPLGVAGQGAEGALSTESGIASMITSPIAPLMAPIGKLIQTAGEGYGSIPAVQQFAMSNAGQATSRVAQDVSNAGNVAGTITGIDQAVKATPGAVQAVKDTASNVADTVKTGATAVKEAIAPSAETQAAQQASTAAAHVQAVAKDWQAPSQLPGGAYTKARAVLAKNPTAPTTLAQSGINPFSHVEDGKYTTADTAESLRATADKISQDTVRPALAKADATDPTLTPASDITDAAQMQAQSLPGVTAGDQVKIQANIASEIDALKAKYPDGMTRVQMHDEKINYSKNSGYNQFKSNADTNAALSNKAISLTLKDAVESSMPKDAPIQETNAHLAKLYSAADYLESLDGKKAPVSAVQNVTRFGLKFGGAALAAHFGPLGDLVSPFAGYQIGKAVDGVLENLSNSGRAEFMKNMAQTNPEAVTKLQQYIQSAPK